MLIQPANALKLSRHTVMDSHQAILPDALRVNADLFLTDLCRYPGRRDVKGLRHPWLLGSCRAILPGTLRASANPLPADWSGNPCRNDESLYCSQNWPNSVGWVSSIERNPTIEGQRIDLRSKAMNPSPRQGLPGSSMQGCEHAQEVNPC